MPTTPPVAPPSPPRYIPPPPPEPAYIPPPPPEPVSQEPIPQKLILTPDPVDELRDLKPAISLVPTAQAPVAPQPVTEEDRLIHLEEQLLDPVIVPPLTREEAKLAEILRQDPLIATDTPVVDTSDYDYELPLLLQRSENWRQYLESRPVAVVAEQSDDAPEEPTLTDKFLLGLSSAWSWYDQHVNQPIYDSVNTWKGIVNNGRTIVSHFADDFADAVTSTSQPSGPLLGPPGWLNQEQSGTQLGVTLATTLPNIIGAEIERRFGLEGRLDEFLNDHRTVQKASNVINNALDYAGGAMLQFAEDMTLGGLSWLTGLQLENGNEVMQRGRSLGRTTSTAVGMLETAVGLAGAVNGVQSIPPTLAATAACSAGSGPAAPACVAVGGTTLVIEGAVVAGGLTVASHGGLVLGRNTLRPIQFSEHGGSSYTSVDNARREVDKWSIEENIQRADERHVEAITRERLGEVLPNSEPGGHMREVESALEGLRNARNRIRAALKSPNWDSQARQYLNNTLNRVEDAIHMMDDALHGPLP